jgi:hypothetical protein
VTFPLRWVLGAIGGALAVLTLLCVTIALSGAQARPNPAPTEVVTTIGAAR